MKPLWQLDVALLLWLIGFARLLPLSGNLAIRPNEFKLETLPPAEPKGRPGGLRVDRLRLVGWCIGGGLVGALFAIATAPTAARRHPRRSVF